MDQDSEKGLTSLLGTLLNLSIFPCSLLLLLQQLSEVTGDTLSGCSEFPKMEHPGMTSPGEEGTATEPQPVSETAAVAAGGKQERRESTWKCNGIQGKKPPH